MELTPREVLSVFADMNMRHGGVFNNTLAQFHYDLDVLTWMYRDKQNETQRVP